MEITDFPTDQYNEYSTLKGTLVEAVNQSRGNTAKTTYLTAVLDAAEVGATTETLDAIQLHEWPQNDTSDDSVPALLIALTNALSRNTLKSDADNDRLVAIIAAANAALNPA